MSIGGCARLAEMDSRRWEAFAEEATLGLPLIRRRVAEIGESVIGPAHEVAAELTMPGLDVEAVARFRRTVTARAGRCMESTGAGADRLVNPLLTRRRPGGGASGSGRSPDVGV